VLLPCTEQLSHRYNYFKFHRTNLVVTIFQLVSDLIDQLRTDFLLCHSTGRQSCYCRQLHPPKMRHLSWHCPPQRRFQHHNHCRGPLNKHLSHRTTKLPTTICHNLQSVVGFSLFVLLSQFMDKGSMCVRETFVEGWF